MKWKSRWVWLLLIWIIGAAAYSNTLTAPFVFDDLVEIVGNSALRNFDIAALAKRYTTRIIPYFTLAANYAASGESVASYHLVNIFIHLLTATVIFFLVRELAKTTGLEGGDLIAGAAALLFVSHPTATQAVTYVIQRLASLAALFYLLGLLLYVLARRLALHWLHVAAFSSIILAMFSKEIAFTAPVAILMIEWFFLRGAGNTPGVELAYSPGVKEAQKNAPRFATPEESLRDTSGVSLTVSRSNGIQLAFAYLLLLLIIPATLWVNRPPLVERENPLAENAVVQKARPLAAETASISRKEYALTQINVVRTYLRLLVFPINQNLDYDYPISHSFLEAPTLGSLVLILAVVSLGVWLYPRNRLASFGVFFFFLALAVESSFVPIRDVMYEHRLYLPSFGFFLAAASAAAPLLKKKVGIIILLVVVSIFMGATLARNSMWQSEERLWLDVVIKSPLKARGWNNLGVAQIQSGDLTGAKSKFEEAISLNPNYAEAYNNLGLLKAQQGDYDAALELFKVATTLEPLYVHAFNNIGVVYIQQQQPQEALAALEMAVGTDDTYIDAKINLAIAYIALGKQREARTQIEAVLSREPDHARARELQNSL